MFQEYFFGAAKKVLGPYGRMHSVKKNRNGRKYIEYTSKRTGNKVRKYLDSMTKSKRSPKKSPKRSPKRARGKTILCRKDLSLAKLRKLALANGINVFSEAKTAISKRTGLPKKPKMVGCSTLMKRMKEAGLSELYTQKMVEVMPEVTPEEIPVLLPEVMPQVMPNVVPEEPVFEEESMELGELFEEPETGDVLRLDPACASEFDKFKRANPTVAKLYKGYAMGPGPCSSRAFVEADDEEAELDTFAQAAGFDMGYGRRYGAGARPRKTQKHVGEIMVKGRRHRVFKGKEGGLYYMKGKSGRKIYIDMKKFKKMKLKNKFGDEQAQMQRMRGIQADHLKEQVMAGIRRQ